MSLPLIYSVEYWHIDDYIQRSFSSEQRDRSYNTEREDELCVFFDRESMRCDIYPVRPLSCRLYGLPLPNELWGVEIPQGAIGAVHCPNMVVLERDTYDDFIAAYHGMWDLMAHWSVENPVLSKMQSEVVRKRIGFESLYLLGWTEFNILRFTASELLEERIGTFWEDYGESL